MISTRRWLMPSSIASTYRVRSCASNLPVMRAASSTGQNPFSSGAPSRASVATPPRKTTNGTRLPMDPPRKVSGAAAEGELVGIGMP
jgi:hypothetical protein